MAENNSTDERPYEDLLDIADSEGTPERTNMFRAMLSLMMQELSTDFQEEEATQDGIFEEAMFLQHVKSRQNEEAPAIVSAELPLPQVAYVKYAIFYNHQKKIRESASSLSTMFAQTMGASHQHGTLVLSPENLCQIRLREIATRINYIHTGRILFAKTVYFDPVRQVGTSVLVEDDAGDLIMLSLYNFIPNDVEPSAVLPIGTRLAVLEPYMKRGRDSQQGELMLRCDNPQFVMRFENDEVWNAAKAGQFVTELVASVHEKDVDLLRTKGNTAFRQGQHERAMKIYTKALNVITSQNGAGTSKTSLEVHTAILSNRAACMISLEKWEEAEDECQRVLALQPEHLKARFRLAHSLLNLQQTVAAEKILQGLKRVKSIKKEVSKLLRVTQNATVEQTSGKFDFIAMKREARFGERAFHGNFLSKKIAIGVSIAEWGRGVVAKAPLKENELLMASRAFVFVHESICSARKELSFDPSGKKMHDSTRSELERRVIRLLQNRPALGSKFYYLSGGKKYKDCRSLGDSMKLDIPRIKAILNCNVFGTSMIGTDELLWLLEADEKCHNGAPPRMMSNGCVRATGLWLNESLFNHSCTPNCTFVTIGSFMFVRATRPIETGEQLFVSYRPTETSYKEDTEGFSTWITLKEGFVCQCQRCSWLRSHPDLGRMNTEVILAYRKGIEAIRKRGLAMGLAADEVLPPQRRAEIMAAHESLPFEVQHSTVALCNILCGSSLATRNHARGALQAFERAAEIGYAVRGGGPQTDRVMDLWRIAGAALNCGGREDKKRAEEVLHEAWKNCFSISALSVSDFVECTLRRCLPFWKDTQGHEMRRREIILRRMAENAAKGTSRSS